MKKLIFPFFLTIWSFLLFSLTLSANNNPNIPTYNTVHEDDACELNPPSSLIVTNVTETTITVTWPHVPSAASYRLTAFNVDLNVPISTTVIPVVSPVVQIQTLSNLPMNTNIRIGVSATACFGGSFGEELAVVQKTDGIIVVDVIVLSPCPPNNGGIVNFDQDITITAIPAQQGQPVIYNEANIKGSINIPNKPQLSWTASVNLIAKICPSGSIKLVCKDVGLENVQPGVADNTQGTYTFLNSTTGGIALQIYSIQKLSNDALKFKVRTFDTNGPTLRYDDNCDDTEVQGDICYQGTYSYAVYSGGGGKAAFGNQAEVRTDIEFEVIPTEETIAAIPNPFNDFTNIQYQISKQSPVSMVLFNAMGQVQRELLNDSQVEPGTYTLPVDMADLAPGVYFLTIQTESGRKITTVVKQ